MFEEKIIDEGELDALLEEVKGESTKTEVKVETEPELELELESEGKEDDGVELEIETDEKGVPTKLKVIQNDEIKIPVENLEKTSFTPQTGLVAPVCSVQESVRIFKEFEKAKKKILTSKDVIWFGDDGRPCEEGRGSPHIKRSGWRKLARFFGLSWDIISVSNAIPMQNGGYMYKTKVKVWHPAGASIIAEGIVPSNDPFLTKGGRKEANEEDVIMKSETVAVNRALDDILGGGEVSAEELE